MNVLLQPGFRRLTLKNFKYSLLCVLIPVVLFTITLQCVRLFNEKKEWESSNRLALGVCEDLLEDLWLSCTQNGLQLINNNQVVTFARTDRSSYSPLMINLFQDIYLRITSICTSNPNISDIVISVSPPEFYIYGKGGITRREADSSSIKTPLDKACYLMTNNAEDGWYPSDSLLYCYIQNTTLTEHQVSCLIAVDPLNIRTRLMRHLNESQGLMLLNADGTPLLQINNALNLPETNGIVYQKGGWQHILSSTSARTGWKLIMNSSEYRFDAAIRSAVMECLFLLVLMSALVAILAFIITIRICRPYQVIASLLKQPIQNDNSYYLENYAEIDDLGMIHDMIYHTRYQLYATQNELESKEQLLKNARLQALKAQINPHFLHNTLENINMKALRLMNGQPNEISDMVCDLSRLMRLSIDMDINQVTLKEEIAHAEVYLKIQQKRFPDRFSVKWDVPKYLLDAMVVSLTLQPLLENALTHGVRKMEEFGHIAITCHEENGDIILSVSDNGPGFDPATLKKTEEMLAGSVLHTSEHVGLFNVHQRLRLTYSENYGLSVESIPYQHTTLTMTFPLNRK